MDYIFGRQDFAGADAQQETFLLAAGTGAYCALSTAFSATRGEHALLMACLRAPTARFDLVHRLTETLAAGSASVCLSTQDKADGPDEDGWRHLVLFDGAGPRWVYEAGGIRVTRRVAMEYGANTVAVSYTVENGAAQPALLTVTPWLRFVPKGRRMTRQRAFAWQEGRVSSGGLDLYFALEGGRAEALPRTRYESIRFRHDAPDGRPATGLCAAAGQFLFETAPGQTQTFAVVFGTQPGLPQAAAVLAGQAERRRAQAGAAGLHSELGRALSAAADAYIVDRASTGGKTIVAGYPFFTDWGRDTMIALPGCTLSTPLPRPGRPAPVQHGGRRPALPELPVALPCPHRGRRLCPGGLALRRPHHRLLPGRHPPRHP